ncbi:hypothetical protein [Ruegeria sp. HKCCSP346]|uniref:hypothetical protein n=1 Tax=Ruegeria sp. HKCCSP346 TaxID=2794830 RepID=UPI001AE388E4|nr:hypothetical protein [Ruegeria sp. HKCCSP346]
MIQLGELYLEDHDAEKWFNSLDESIAEQVASLAALRAFLVTLAVATRQPKFDLTHWRETHADIRLALCIVNKAYLPWRPTFSSPPSTFQQMAHAELDVTLTIQSKFATYCLENANGTEREHWFEALKFCALALAKLSSGHSSGFKQAQKAVSLTWSRVIEHAKEDATDLNSTRFTEIAAPLFSEDWLSGELSSLWKFAIARYDNDPPEGPRFQYWRDWYRGLLIGKPLDLELQYRLFVIDDTIWDEGPEAVSEEIEKIHARLQTERALTELKDSLSTQTIARHGIGGNNPPESIEDERLSGAITLIWEATEELSTALEEDRPARERIEAILAKFKAGLVGLLKWCVGKANLAVGTVIVVGSTKGTTAIVDAYIAKHPEKIEALIEAIERWLPLLS